ncbi:DUF2935 domain-containing protein [Mechercharimyces sp. CAU 1602]|uniref:DUF2935 domain-containing protein n=1 Tax=Mechercharimyces sp. CAU 1602 TaxID=2973933 RepID=UPI002162A537|nr:DUF2935 domain-containing protein [Mechercharimyces sp. CAU 1602]MCS1352052.1 DUF2935 domain-containing protein [Mechercharimyces sp. CAU 1602]
MELSVWQEHRFWLGVLDDHAVFVYDFLAPKEKEWVQAAEEYNARFRLLESELMKIQREAPASSQEMIEFARRAYPVVTGYYELESRIQRLRIMNDIQISLTPTYFNGTLAENDEYIRMLKYYTNGQVPPRLSLVDLSDLWLTDQYGHASLLFFDLDLIEGDILARTNKFRDQFATLLLQNRAIKGYLRMQEQGFPRQEKLAYVTATTVNEFYRFVEYVVREYELERLMNRTSLRFLEHHLPESCYFLKKLSYYAPAVNIPHNCSLINPATETKE